MPLTLWADQDRRQQHWSFRLIFACKYQQFLHIGKNLKISLNFRTLEIWSAFSFTLYPQWSPTAFRLTISQSRAHLITRIRWSVSSFQNLFDLNLFWVHPRQWQLHFPNRAIFRGTSGRIQQHFGLWGQYQPHHLLMTQPLPYQRKVDYQRYY